MNLKRILNIISIQSLGVNSPHSLQRLQEMEPSFLKLKREMKYFLEPEKYLKLAVWCGEKNWKMICKFKDSVILFQYKVVVVVVEIFTCRQYLISVLFYQLIMRGQAGCNGTIIENSVVRNI